MLTMPPVNNFHCAFLYQIVFTNNLISYVLCMCAIDTQLVFCLLQYSTLSILYQIIIIAAIIVMTLVEVIRLYLGYLGNLTEKVHSLIWMILIICWPSMENVHIFDYIQIKQLPRENMHITDFRHIQINHHKILWQKTN